MTDNPLEEIAKLSTLAYHNAELTKRQQVQLFIIGLVNPLKTDVALHRLATLDDANMLARAYEQH